MIDETQNLGLSDSLFPDAYRVSMQYRGTAVLFVINISKKIIYHVSPEFRMLDCAFGIRETE